LVPYIFASLSIIPEIPAKKIMEKEKSQNYENNKELDYNNQPSFPPPVRHISETFGIEPEDFLY
jgi:hypothetical protein